MKSISRKDARQLLRRQVAKTFTRYERRAILEELWMFMDEEKRFDAEDLAFYPKEIREEMLTQRAPADPDDPKYDFIIAERVSPHLYLGVKNDYLLKLIRKEGLQVDRITGENEKLDLCLCCNYRTITPGVEGRGETCPVCCWVNTSEKANHLSLDEARKNFKAFGVFDQRLLPMVDPEAKKKFDRG